MGEKSLEQHQNILNSLFLGIFTVDRDWKITFFNNKAEEITGLKAVDVKGHYCYEVFRGNLCPDGCYIKKAIESGKKYSQGDVIILNKADQKVPINITGAVLTDEKGNIIGGLGSFRDRSLEISLEKKLKESYTLDDMIGKAEKIKKIFEMIPSVAESLCNVLILGETGTGKDLLARTVHNLSPRSKGPYIKVNCAALPEHLLESELFGYNKGAFTDAKRNKPGMFQLAQRGTIFLDEIGDLPTLFQSKILQVLDDKEFFPLGSTKPVKVDVRVVSSTNQDIKGMIERKLFRKDLYYRLNTMEITLPPLRERKSDIPLLIEKLLEGINNDMGKNVMNVSKAALQLFLNYNYPGNVRELKNILENTVALCENTIIHQYDLPQVLIEERSTDSLFSESMTLSHRLKPLAVIERKTILEFLDQCQWDMKETAKLLHIDKSTLWRKMKKYNLSVNT
ncbi:MAG: sigma-54 interaction domain-containing protein [Thermodesulfobacteriota bacterium]